MAYLCGTGNFRNTAVFIATMIVILTILVAFTPLSVFFREAVLSAIGQPDVRKGGFVELTQYMRSIDYFALGTLQFLSGLIRLSLSVVFVASCLLRPLIMRPVSLVWARIVESEKPVFTVIFGGAAAFATAISEAVKHL